MHYVVLLQHTVMLINISDRHSLWPIHDPARSVHSVHSVHYTTQPALARHNCACVPARLLASACPPADALHPAGFVYDYYTVHPSHAAVAWQQPSW